MHFFAALIWPKMISSPSGVVSELRAVESLGCHSTLQHGTVLLCNHRSFVTSQCDSMVSMQGHGVPALCLTVAVQHPVIQNDPAVPRCLITTPQHAFVSLRPHVLVW